MRLGWAKLGRVRSEGCRGRCSRHIRFATLWKRVVKCRPFCTATLHTGGELINKGLTRGHRVSLGMRVWINRREGAGVDKKSCRVSRPTHRNVAPFPICHLRIRQNVSRRKCSPLRLVIRQTKGIVKPSETAGHSNGSISARCCGVIIQLNDQGCRGGR